MWGLKKTLLTFLFGITLLGSVFAVAGGGGGAPVYHVVAVLNINPNSGSTAVNFSFDPTNSYCYYYTNTGIRYCPLTGGSIKYGDGSEDIYDSPPFQTTHKYSTPGTYEVTLRVCHYGTCASTTKTLIVTNQPPTADAGPDATVKVNHLITLNGSGTDEDGSIVLYEWDFDGDGTYDWSSTANGVTTYKYDTPGTYTAILRVTDDEGATNTDSTVITVIPNQPPIADAGQDMTVLVNELVTFNASNSTDPDGVITNYLWNFGDGTTSNGVTVTHSYSNPGTFTVILNVTDDDGVTTTDQIIVTVLAEPVAVINTNTTKGYSPLSVLFNASDSYDIDGNIISYHWDFNDSTTSTNAEETHEFTAPGEYNVTLTVTDNDGLTSTAWVLINVTQNQDPVITSFNVNTTQGTAPLTVEFNASATDDEQLTFTLIFDVNNPADNITGVITSTEAVIGTHTYSTAGNYIAELIVEDGFGGRSTSNITINVTQSGSPSNQPPVAVADANVTEGKEPLTVQFNASSSYDPDGTIANYFWDFNDSTNSTDAEPVHVFTNAGVYNITLTVTDDQGATNTTLIIVNVTPNQAPVANFSYTNSSWYLFNFTDESTDADGVIVSWFWDFGDGTNSTEQNPAHEFPHVTADYNVTLTVTDDNGAMSNYTVLISIVKPQQSSGSSTNPGGGGGFIVKKIKENESETNETSENATNETTNNETSGSVITGNEITQANESASNAPESTGSRMTAMATSALADPEFTPIITFLSIIAAGLFALERKGLTNTGIAVKKRPNTRKKAKKNKQWVAKFKGFTKKLKP